jgi:hypothetical protein
VAHHLGRRLVPVSVIGLLLLATCGGTGPRTTPLTGAPGGGGWTSPTAGTTIAPPSTPVPIVLYGDSLAVEAQETFQQALTASGRAEVWLRTFVGTAICDFFGAMQDDLGHLHPAAVVMAFSGNAMTPCMSARPGAPSAVLDRYRADADAVMRLYEPASTGVYWIGPPISRRAAETGDPSWAQLLQLYSGLADRYPNARYVDAGRVVLRGGGYTDVLPCLAGEPCAGWPDPVTGQPANRVRSPDGLHFCPVAVDSDDGATSHCPVWSSGAWRFGLAMARPLVEDFDLDAGAPAQTDA